MVQQLVMKCFYPPRQASNSTKKGTVPCSIIAKSIIYNFCLQVFQGQENTFKSKYLIEPRKKLLFSSKNTTFLFPNWKKIVRFGTSSLFLLPTKSTNCVSHKLCTSILTEQFRRQKLSPKPFPYHVCDHWLKEECKNQFSI